MNRRERIEAALHGAPVDRVPVALSRHWPVDDQQGADLARATLAFQHEYDLDLIKVTPDSDFCITGYGAVCHWEGNEEGTRAWGPRVIQQPEDWERLRPLEPSQGLLGEVLEANRLIGAHLRDEDDPAPFVQTIFNPLAQAKNLAGGRLYSDLRQHPDALHAALRVITETMVNFIHALKQTGAAGIFLAVQHASFDLLNEAEYRTFGVPYDSAILEAASDLWCNVVHLHGSNVMFDLVAGYPAQVINWHDTETPPTLAEALARTPMTLCGGLRQWATLVRGTPAAVRAEAEAAIAATGGRRLILGTGCVTPIIAPTCNMHAARRSVG